MFGKLVTILLIIFSPVCFGSVTKVEVSALLGSYHWDKVNDASGVARNNGTYGAIFNVAKGSIYVYKNSFDDLSMAMGYRASYSASRLLSAHITIGAVYGYAWNSDGYSDADAYGARPSLLLFVLPSVSIRTENIVTTAHLFPSGMALSVGYVF